MERLKYLALLILFISSGASLATPYYGARFSYSALTDIPFPHGYQFMLSYDPQRFQWREFNVYFDGGYTHFWTGNNTLHFTTLDIFSIAPVVHYTFKRRGPLLPYLELSIGAAYLNHLRLDYTPRNQRNLGMHFAFQDRFGLGFSFGGKDQFAMGVHAVHYSNAGLSENNSGVTAPLMVDLSYRF